MSLAINLDHVVAVYALGEWHDVQKGTCFTDAYEVKESFDAEDHRVTWIEMGEMYPKVDMAPVPRSDPGSIGFHWRFVAPSGMTGISWKDKAGRQVSMSIQEIKGWKTEN